MGMVQMVTRPIAHRELLDFLRDGYGIVVAPTHGHDHDYVEFEWMGRRRRITINHRDSRGFNLKRQDVVRELGPPLALSAKPIRERRTLAAMTTELQAAAASGATFNPLPLATPTAKPLVGSCRVACYGKSTSCFRFSFTSDLVAQVFPMGRIFCEPSLDGEAWLFRESSDGRELRVSTSKKDCYEFSLTQGAVTPFQSTTATIERLPAGDGILVTVPMSERRPVNAVRSAAMTKGARRAKAGTPMPAPVEPPPTPPAQEWRALPAVKGAVSALFLRNILKEIIVVERDSTYRLVKIKTAAGAERWEWRAPSIRLDDSE